MEPLLFDPPRRRGWLAVVLVGLLFVLTASCPRAPVRVLRLSGASTLLPLCQQAAGLLAELHPDLRIELQAGGTTRGIHDTIAGRNDLGMVARDLVDDERGRVVVHPIARDAVALVVHADNPLEGLTTAQLCALYRREHASWRELVAFDRAVHLVHKAEGHATREVFLAHTRLPRDAVRPHVVAADNAQVVATVAADRGALGYVSLGDAELAIASGEPLRVIALDDVRPTLASVKDGSYPMVRILYLVSLGQPRADAQRFLELLRSPRGQQLLEEYFLVPID